MTKTVLKPSQVLRMIRKGKLSDSIKGGHPVCLKCKTVGDHYATESPSFWENGSYCKCKKCDEMTLHGAVYPATEGYPDGFMVDTSGERKAYPMVLEKSLIA